MGLVGRGGPLEATGGAPNEGLGVAFAVGVATMVVRAQTYTYPAFGRTAFQVGFLGGLGAPGSVLNTSKLMNTS